MSLKVEESLDEQSSVLSKMVEVKLTRSDSFAIIRETLTRVGITNADSSVLFQTCHILHKRGHYFITHFKLMFEANGRKSNMNSVDYVRQWTIANLLQEWNLASIIDQKDDVHVDKSLVTIVPASEKKRWELIPKYTFQRRNVND